MNWLATSPLRLHVADGRVWYGVGDKVAVQTVLAPEAFVKEYASGPGFSDTVRLLGCRETAPLIVLLREAMLRTGRETKIRLASPAVVPTRVLRLDPASVLYHLWQPTRAALAPGLWHDFEHLTEFPMYALLSTAEDETGLRRRIAASHPAWPALTFVASEDTDAGIRLLCEIVDPRWYTHPTRPGRLTRLYAALGLTPENFAALARGREPGRNGTIAFTALCTWFGPATTPESPGFQTSGFSRLNDRTVGDQMLLSTKRVVAFIVHAWLGALDPRQKFDPKQFFGNDEDAAAYLAHYATAG